MDGSDVIHMRGLEFFAYHGALPEEGTLGQRFVVDVDLYVDLHQAGESDQVADTVSYAEVYQTIKHSVVDKRFNLLEALAKDIADNILRQYACPRVRVEVFKPQVPIPAVLKDVSIEIWRERAR